MATAELRTDIGKDDRDGRLIWVDGASQRAMLNANVYVQDKVMTLALAIKAGYIEFNEYGLPELTTQAQGIIRTNAAKLPNYGVEYYSDGRLGVDLTGVRQYFPTDQVFRDLYGLPDPIPNDKNAGCIRIVTASRESILNLIGRIEEGQDDE